MEGEILDSSGSGRGVAGRSLRREYERRRSHDQELARQKGALRVALVVVAALVGYFGVQLVAALINHFLHSHLSGLSKPPFAASTAHEVGYLLGGFLALATAAALWRPRQSTEAFRIGAEGEDAVGTRLEKVEEVTVLHNRRRSGRGGDIDHIVVGSAGVYVIDDKKTTTKGRVSTRRAGPFWKPGPTKLFLGGRDRSSWIEGMAKQVEAVSRALAGVPEAAGVPVRAMVVVVGAERGLLAQPLNVEGVWVGWPKEAARFVARPGPLSAEVRGRLAQVLMERLPEA